MTSRLHLEHKTPAVSRNALLVSFERHLRAERKDPDTIAHYVGASQQFLDYCTQERLPAVENVTREHVEMWLEALHERYRPHTVRNRYIGLRIFYKWLAEEGEIAKNPMARIKPPSVEESPKDVVTQENMAKVLAMLEKAKRWRDCALIALLYDTGMRTGELADLRTEHVNLYTGVIFLMKTKAGRIRTVHLSPKGIRYVDRYHRRPRADEEYLLNGPRGKLTRSGIYWAVRRAFEEAGVPGTIGGHDLRHTSASHVAEAGLMGESDAMALYGWSDPDMYRHYSAQARAKAALDAHARSSPLERLPNPAGRS
jgi:integrase/recombinase XerD